MSTMTGFVFLFFLGACVHQSSQITSCAHNHDCPESQCCRLNEENPPGWGGPGYCRDYYTEGDYCGIFYYFSCGCLPSLECLPLNGSNETCNMDVPKVCTNTSAPYVRPASRALCYTDTDCPTSDECCSEEKFDWTDYFPEWQLQYRGKCKKCEYHT